MKKIILMLLSVCVLSTFATVSAVTAEPNTAFGTYSGSFTASMSIPAHTTSFGTYPAWTLDIRMNYSAQYNLNTGKISSVAYTGAAFYPGNTVSPDGYAYATSINYDSINASISSDGYSITFIPHAGIYLIYYQFPSYGGNPEPFQTSVLTGSSVTLQPNTF